MGRLFFHIVIRLNAMPNFALENQLPQICHPLGIEYAIEMVTFVLDDTGMKAARSTLNGYTIKTDTTINEFGRPWH
jgi:tRNA G26 N,N-dimethylase Trm1